MMRSVETRIRRLEADAGGDGECLRCAGVVAIFMNDEFSSAHKNGEPMSEEEFEGEEDGAGRCPACGQKSEGVSVGWPVQDLPQ